MIDIVYQKTAKLLWIHPALFRLAFACCVGMLLGVASILVSPLVVLVGLLAIGFLAVMVRRPEIGLLAIVMMTSTILFEDSLPLIPIGVGSLNVADVLLLALLAMIIVRRLAEPEFKLVHTPLDLPLLTFWAMMLLSTFVAMGSSSVSTTEALRGIRTITYYLTFFIVTNLVRRKAQLSLLIEGLLLLAMIVAGAMVAQSLVGRSIILFPGRVETLVTQNSVYNGVTRVLPPGQSLVMFGFIVLVALTATDQTSSRFIIRFLQASLVGLGVILTFNRNFWVIAGLALALLAWLLRGQDRQRLLGRGLLAVLLGSTALGFAFTLPESRVEGLIQATVARLDTLFNSNSLQEDSLQYRYVENAYALPQIASHPIIGLGLRTPYRPWDRGLDGSVSGLWHTDFDPRTYIHNGHLWVLLTSGWLGYLALAWLSVAFLIRGFKNWRTIADVKMRAIMLVCVLTYMGVSVAAIVSPIYMQWYWIPLLGIMMGASETILRSCQERSRD